MRPHQLSFLPRTPTEHGGNLHQGKRKTARPIAPKLPIHLVLRSSRARGAWSLLHSRNVGHVRRIVDTSARKYGVRVYRYANVGNHIHLLIQPRTKTAFRGFLREVSGRIASLVTGARKSHPVGNGRFWDFLAYTRIMSWGRDFNDVEKYFVKNLFEAAGLLTRRAKAAGLKVISIMGWVAREGPS
jgi:REP element-mobilizing transposase RayT